MQNTKKKIGGASEIGFKEGFELLLKEAESYQKPPYENPTILRLKDIRRALSIFQPRHIRHVGETCASLAHRDELLNALKVSGGMFLDPITVYWTGQAYRVLDGHHRLEAYLEHFKGKLHTTVPVRLFKGSPEEAVLMAIELNSKNHLPMSKDERFDRAWQMTVMGIGSKATVARTCKMAQSTIGVMRARANELEADYKKLMGEWPSFDPEDWKLEASKMTWAEAKKQVKRKYPEEADFMEHAVNDFAKRFGKQFGTQMANKAEIVAYGLSRYSERLAKELYQILHADYGEEETLESDF